MHVVVGKVLSVKDFSALLTLGNTGGNAFKEAGDPCPLESQNVKECGEARPGRPQRETLSCTGVTRH